MGFGGAALKIGQTLIYALAFCCSAIILGIYSYFLSVLADRDAPIYTWVKAVEGMSGAAVLYTIFAVILTVCLGGKKFFAFLALVLDILFCGAMVAIAVLTRDGAHSCRGRVATPLGTGQHTAKQGFGSGNGQGDQYTYAVSLGTACTLNKVCFAVAIVGALLFLLAALMQIALARHHKKEKRFGPSPANGYTAGTGNRFWQRRKARPTGMRDPEMAAGTTTAGTLAPGHKDYRPSHDTAYTGSTVAPQNAAYEPHKPLVGGYHAAPTGTYNQPGYNNTAATNY